MSVIPSVSPTSNPLLADALQRAQALAGSKTGLKRPSEELLSGPDFKKPSFDQQQGYQGNGNMQAAGAPGMGSEQVMVPLSTVSGT